MYKQNKSCKRNFKVQDEWTTPSILVDCIIPYVKEWARIFEKLHQRPPVIWCPFDKAESKYVEILEREGFFVIHSRIEEGKDFFKYEPDEYDIIISNPPFSMKLKIFERICFDLKKPFVLLMNIMALNYQEIGNLFQFVGREIQFIIPDKKVSFDGHTSSFCSGYVCYRFIDRTEFIHLENNNTGENFRK